MKVNYRCTRPMGFDSSSSDLLWRDGEVRVSAVERGVAGDGTGDNGLFASDIHDGFLSLFNIDAMQARDGQFSSAMTENSQCDGVPLPT